MASLKETFQKALSLHQAGELGAARALYAQALAVEPRHFDSLHLMGLAMVQQGDLEDGISHIRRALAVKPGVAEAHYNLGHALLTAGEPGAALDSFTAALRINPADAQYHVEAGNALKELARPDEAIACYDAALRLDPRLAEAHNNRGIALKDAGLPEEAVASYDMAIGLRPRYAEAHSNRGNALKDMGRFEEALACHERAIDLKPDYAEARYNKALLLLGLGRFREGFPLYDIRWQTAGFDSEPFRGDVPRWDGSGGDGQVLLWAEQGIGDEILHGSLLPLVPAGVAITLAADPRLHAIYRRSLPQISLVAREVVKGRIDGGYRAQAPIGDLGTILGVDAGRLAARPPAFLRADAGRRAALRASPSFPGSGPVVGIAWKSSNKRFGAEKSLRLVDLAPLLGMPGRSFVNLQYGAVAEEIAEAKAALGVTVNEVEGLDTYNDIDGLVALIDACDVVVTTSNVTAHLAGAIGKKGVVLVPGGKGLLWYWKGGGNDLWYPSLTRAAQPRIGDWQPAIASAAAWVRDNT